MKAAIRDAIEERLKEFEPQLKPKLRDDMLFLTRDGVHDALSRILNAARELWGGSLIAEGTWCPGCGYDGDGPHDADCETLADLALLTRVFPADGTPPAPVSANGPGGGGETTGEGGAEPPDGAA